MTTPKYNSGDLAYIIVGDRTNHYVIQVEIGHVLYLSVETGKWKYNVIADPIFKFDFISLIQEDIIYETALEAFMKIHGNGTK